MTTSKEKFALTTSRGFNKWLADIGGSLAFTTYQAGKVFFLGLKPDGNLSVFERTFPRSMGMGLSGDGRSLLLATQSQIYRFDNILSPGAKQGVYDAAFAPHQSWITGDLDIHDIDFGKDGEPIFVNTLFNCIGTVSEGYSFKPVWRPEFISKLAAEDRCHLNGMAVQDGLPKYVTCVSKSDVSDGWRDKRDRGGLVIDVETNEIVCEGLSMPHSPRLHGGKLWIVNSGSGELGWVDTKKKEFNPVCFCPGYARGLSFAGKYALIGLSLARDNRTFQGLQLNETLIDKDTDARCGLLIVDTETGDTIEWVRIEGVIKELFDVSFLPNIQCPSAIGLKGNEILRLIAIDDEMPD